MELFPNKSIFITVQFSHSVVSDSWRPHGLQHARLPCPSLASNNNFATGKKY